MGCGVVIDVDVDVDVASIVGSIVGGIVVDMDSLDKHNKEVDNKEGNTVVQ
jgi:hypothetical protein